MDQTADSLGAFLPGPRLTIEGAAQGPLHGRRFAVKDIYDIAGHVTGCGNPDWARTHEAAHATAPSVEALLGAGASVAGKTITDELAFSLNGQNAHYGTPVNSACPGRIPGGSSSGSASAVAGGAVDFALGSDTGGSVRVPAALCGIFGIRTTHGRIPLEGIMPLAPSFDTVGWFSRDADLLAQVGRVLLAKADESAGETASLLLAEDAFALAEPDVREALRAGIEAAATAFGDPVPVEAGGGEALRSWMLLFRHLQACEIWKVHGDWIEATEPRFGPEIAARFAWAKQVASEPEPDAPVRREAFTARLHDLLADGSLLCLPAAPSIAPLLETPADALIAFRESTLSLTCIAGLARLPQVTIPAGQVEGCPAALSLIGGPGTDLRLLDAADVLARALGGGDPLPACPV